MSNNHQEPRTCCLVAVLALALTTGLIGCNSHSLPTSVDNKLGSSYEQEIPGDGKGRLPSDLDDAEEALDNCAIDRDPEEQKCDPFAPRVP